MQNSNSLFDLLLKTFLTHTFGTSSSDPRDTRNDDLAFYAALGLLVLAGADAMKVVFRKNFGIRGLSLIRVGLSFVAFMIIAVLGFYYSSTDVEINPVYGTHATYFMGGLFYLIFGLYVLGRGMKHKKERPILDAHPDYKGDSALLGFLMKSGWSQTDVQNWAEPLLVLFLGGFLSAINLLWGLPLVFCALSIWGYQIVEYLFGGNAVKNKIQQHGYQNQNDDFTQMR